MDPALENIQPEVHTAPLNVLMIRREQVKLAKKLLEKEASELAEDSMAKNDEARELNIIIMELTKAIEDLRPKQVPGA